MSKAGLALILSSRGPNTAEPVLDLITRLLKQGWPKQAFLVSSFDHRQLEQMRKLDKHILLGALINGLLVDDATFAQKLGAYSVHPSIEFIDQRFVDDAQAKGIKVYPYTVNHPEDIDKMYQLGVDGVFTDYPDRVVDSYPQGEYTRHW